MHRECETWQDGELLREGKMHREIVMQSRPNSGKICVWSAEKCKNRRKNGCGGALRQTKSDVGGCLVCWGREKWDDLLNTN